MGLKHHTIILVPHGRARFRKWRISSRELMIGTVVVSALAVIAALSIWSFFAKAVDQQQLADLAAENQALREVNQEFENSIRDLRGELAGFEQRTEQLAIVAGVDEIESGQQSGVGGDGLQQRSDSLGRRLDRIEASLDNQIRQAAATPAISPVRGILTSAYGYRKDPISGERALHRAVDLSTAPGQPVMATADGIVLRAERSGRLGNAVVIAHGFGFTTRYGHLSRFAVQAGERVARGEVIGYVGNTGRATGYHLHYEVLADGSPVNPLIYILDEKPRRF
jgi:murein DD-endopeptidase MepM/ murein hydrolase activator NlpD